MSPRRMTLGVLALALPLVSVHSAAAGDSGHYSCSGVGISGSQRISLIVRIQDFRGAGGSGRDYVLSALHRDSLYKGPARKVSQIERDGSLRVQGAATLTSGPHVFFSGSFEMRYGPQASLLLEGAFRPDPAAKEPIQITVTLPCIDVSP